jgi:class 3 adenylate cyclase
MSDSVPQSTKPTAPSGERRQVTALFADMVGFTAISERLGEEGTFALIQPIYELMASAVKEQGGSVKDFTGDGIMALFGVPEALEDAPLRACRAGLLMHKRLASAAPAIEVKHGVQPQMRIGVNSGLAVVTQIRGESAAMTALGDTVNLASRLQTLAEPGTVYLSEATQRLVQGLVETTFAGAHAIKGKAEAQKVYRLDAIREGATRFGAAIDRGLSAYVGRERELDILERGLFEARSRLQIVDVTAEPGMGKSRLLHEFHHRVTKEQAFILSGGCSPDGQQTPFLPFIEVVRGSFQVRAGEAEEEIARKLEMGLTVLGMHSLENLGLLLNLLGLKPPERALVGLDGLLIGLRTRDLLQQLLEARCRLSPVVLLIEDIHWIDSVSEEVLGKIVRDETKQRLLLVHTRRPEYEPGWLDLPTVMTLRLEPLPAGDVKRIIQTRLGVDALPEAFTRLVTEKAEGNALFAEEIVIFLTEQGALRAVGRAMEFDAAKVAAALPASVQSLLTARVDLLAPQERALLQAAAVIGRRFDPDLLAVVSDDRGHIEARLTAMQALDLVYPEDTSGDYAFKHALVRDALYQSLLTGPRAALHLRIAEEVERRGGNRLAEVAEILAHHYSNTDRADKAFAYLAMAGAKSLGVYSLDEAGNNFDAAIARLDKNPDCANDQQVGELLLNYTLCSNALFRIKATTETVERFMPRLDTLGDDPTRIIVQHHYAIALIWSARSREAQKAQTDLSAMAARLRDARSRAYELTSAIFIATIVAPYPAEIFEAIAHEAIAAASSIDDPYLQSFARYGVGCEELFQGRMTKARESAEELMAIGRRMKDSRSIGLGIALQASIATGSDDYVAALNFADIGMSVARTPYERVQARFAMAVALVALRRPEAIPTLRDLMDQCSADGAHFYVACLDGFWGIALITNGEIGAGIRWIEQSIIKREREGFRRIANWHGMFLCEVYLEIISGKEKAPIKVLVRNALTLVIVMLRAQKRISSLVDRVRQNPQFDPNGHFIGRCELILGLLYKARKKRVLAVQHLTEAKRIAAQFGPTPMLAKIDAALAEVADLADMQAASDPPVEPSTPRSRTAGFPQVRLSTAHSPMSASRRFETSLKSLKCARSGHRKS